MNTSINCPKCSGEMQEGFTLDMSLANRLVSRWVCGKPEEEVMFGAKISDKEQYAIQTLRCIKCGFLESYAKDT